MWTESLQKYSQEVDEYFFFWRFYLCIFYFVHGFEQKSIYEKRNVIELMFIFLLIVHAYDLI